jgi:FtsP/CotA-like multicopper oxidase with cupredoxin domain
MYLPWRTSKRRIKEAEVARSNRLEIVKALSQGQVTRRELIRMGVMTAGGALVMKHGLHVLAPSAYAAVPTGTPISPIPANSEFNQPMPRFEVLQKKPMVALSPYPTKQSNQALNAAKGVGPIEGRPPGKWFEHQRWDEFYPRACYEVSQAPLIPNLTFHPNLPMINADKVWTFNGSLPPKLIQARYGEPILMRHWNRLPANPADNGGFGRNTITTHMHNGHNPAESDGYAGAFFFSGQFYDYRWPLALAGHDTINTQAADPRAGGPTDDGGIMQVRGDWRETQSTLWFHDHMIDFTSQNVYKGNAAMINLYSSMDRGNEEIDDGVNLRLPSGTAKAWGNVDYDVNLVIADKAFDPSGQMYFDVFNHDGFVGDAMTVNFAYKPYFEVERRKYRFRILNGGVSRFLAIALSDGLPFTVIATDGNLLERPLQMTRLPQQGVAERYDIVIDFSRYSIGQKVHLVNLAEHNDGLKVANFLTLGEALAGSDRDPAVGRFLEFRVARDPGKPDASRIPAQMIPLPERKPVVRERTFEFGKSGGTSEVPWTIKADFGDGFGANLQRISAAPRSGTSEVWHLVNGGGGWDHPIHIHFEEGQTIARDGGVPDHERLGRKDVWSLGPGGRVSVYLQFREFAGTYVEHCHNTVHEDHAMLIRWDINGGPTPVPNPVPSPSGCSYVDSAEG